MWPFFVVRNNKFGRGNQIQNNAVAHMNIWMLKVRWILSFSCFAFHISFFVFHLVYFVFHLLFMFCCYVSLFMFRFSCFAFHVSLFMFRFSCFAFHVSLFMFRFSCFVF